VPERILDVSELEAPEPLLRAIDTVETLGSGEYLRFCHRMKPCHLYRYLEENGFHSDTRHGLRHECEVFIWREGDKTAAAEAGAASAGLKPWSEGEA
jgi:hypothetical protein